MSATSKEWKSRWQPGDPTLNSLVDAPDEEPSEPIIELMDDIDELQAINKQLLAENEQLGLQLEQQQPIIQDFEKRAKKLINEFEPFIQRVKELIDVLCAIDTAQPFWNISIDVISVKLHHFCIVNSEMLTLIYNNPNFDREVKKNIETIRAVHTTLTSHDLDSPQSAPSLLIELHHALQILDLD